MTKNNGPIAEKSIELPSNLKYVKEGSNFALENIKGLSLDESMCYDIKFSIEEALINAMKYGNKLKEDIKTRLRLLVYKDKVKILVEDSGSGFDYNNLPDPTKNDDAINKHSGRGIYLIKRLMDKVEFNEKGNQIRMIKFIRG